MAAVDKSGFLAQALRRVRLSWQSIAGSEYAAAVPDVRPDLPGDDLERIRAQMRACLDGRGGEVSARARAAALGRSYLTLDGAGRERFLRVLADDFDVVDADVDAAVASLRSANCAAPWKPPESNC